MTSARIAIGANHGARRVADATARKALRTMETMVSNIWGLLLVTGGETAFPDVGHEKT